MTPRFDVGASPAVMRAVRKGLPEKVIPAWDDLVARLRADPRFVPPDKRVVWRKAFKDIPNHRHTDLPGAWRACWTIHTIGSGRPDRVVVIFLGSHKRYDRTYGFQAS